MTPIEAQFYHFAGGLVQLALVVQPIAWPFVIMGVILMVIRRAFVAARGERDYGDLVDDFETARGRLAESTLAARRAVSRRRGYGPVDRAD